MSNLDRLRQAVWDARVYAGENLPAAPGLVIVHMLEKALKESKMGQDNGMDCTPSWQELDDLNTRMVHENEAMAAHVEQLQSTLEPFARAWQQREPAGDYNSKGYQRRLERSLLPFYSTGNVDEFSLTGEHLREAARALSSPVGTTSLARRDARVAAEALEKAAALSEANVANWLNALADEYRRQAEGGES